MPIQVQEKESKEEGTKGDRKMYELAILLICYFSAVEIYCAMWIADYIKDKKKRKDEAFRRLCRKDIEARLSVKRNREKLWRTVRK